MGFLWKWQSLSNLFRRMKNSIWPTKCEGRHVAFHPKDNQVLAEGLLPMRPALWSVETAPRGALNSSAAHFQSRGLNLSKTKQTKMMHPKQKLIFKSMTPEEKLKVALRLIYSSRELKAAGLRVNHPNWTEEEIRKKVREIFLYART